jgi:2-polyprenyl-3-methyl-5-hydroxy-6-metoxy-1,4-benzoquinol methylase
MTLLPRKIPRCWCGGRLQNQRVNLGEIPLCDRYEENPAVAREAPRSLVEIAICEYCQLVQLTERFAPSQMYGRYIYLTSDSPGLVDHFIDYAAFIIQQYPEAVKIIDIGCNEGVLLREIKKAKSSVEVLGVEPSKIGAAGCKVNQVDLIEGYFSEETVDEILAKNGPQDLVLANNVVANIENLAEFMVNVNRLLKDGGRFIFESITFDGIFNSMTVEMINHEHYYYFTRGSVQNLSAAFGFSLEQTLDMSLKGGSSRYVCRKIDPVDSQQMVSFNSDDHRSEEVLAEFNSRFMASREKLLHHLAEKQRNGAKVYGFGAHAGATILTYAFGLEAYIEKLFDDNDRRIGLHSPGAAVPVCDLDTAEISPNSVLLIFAWRYFAQIKSRHLAKMCGFDEVISFLPHFILHEIKTGDL